jgi:hypothetical protein
MISLDEVTDAIRKQMVANGMNFSHWVRQQLNATLDIKKEIIEAPKPKPGKNYLCRNCMMAGHWTADCPHLEVSQ